MRISGLSLSLAIMASALPAIGQTPNPEAENYREIILDIPEKATIRQTIVKTSEKNRGGKKQGSTVNSEYLNTVITTKDGYKVSKKLVDSDLTLSGQDQDAAKAAQKMAEQLSLISTIEYTASYSLSPITIDNWPYIKSHLKAGFTSSLGDAGAQVFETIYGNVDGSGAAELLLQGETMLAKARNVALHIGEAITEESEFPAPVGGVMLKATESLTLEEYDEANAVAKITYVYSPTPESLNTFINTMVPEFFKGMDIKDDSAELQTLLKSSKFEMSTRCDYDVRLETGLVTKGNCQIIRNISLAGETNSQIDTWQLSETLVP